MKKTTLSLLIAVLSVLALLLSACGSAGSSAKDEMFEASGNFYKGDYEYGMTEAEDAYVKETPTSDTNTSDYAEKIIRDVNMYAETRDFDNAVAEIRRAVSLLGGYEESVSITGRSYHSGAAYCRTAKMTLRLPAAELDAFLNQVGDMVNVTNQSANTRNVTAAYYDIQSRISVLESEKAAYEEMLQQSKDVNYLLQIKDRLYNVIEEIESYKTQLRLYDNKVSYSTVTMSLDEVIEYSKVTTPEDSFGTKIKNAFAESWQDFADGFQRFVVWLVYAFPTLLVIAAIAAGAIVILIFSSRRAKLRAKKATEKNSDETK